jgi:hypothetical protein
VRSGSAVSNCSDPTLAAIPPHGATADSLKSAFRDPKSEINPASPHIERQRLSGLAQFLTRISWVFPALRDPLELPHCHRFVASAKQAKGPSRPVVCTLLACSIDAPAKFRLGAANQKRTHFGSRSIYLPTLSLLVSTDGAPQLLAALINWSL